MGFTPQFTLPLPGLLEDMFTPWPGFLLVDPLTFSQKHFEEGGGKKMYYPTTHNGS